MDGMHVSTQDHSEDFFAKSNRKLARVGHCMEQELGQQKQAAAAEETSAAGRSSLTRHVAATVPCLCS